MILHLHSNRLRSITVFFVSRFLVLFVLSSFALTLLPIATTSADHSSMPCCAGKEEGHCDSGLLTPKPPPPPVTEPMCGLTSHHSQTSRKAETTSSHTDVESNASQVSAAESISEPCHMDCGACATVTTRNKRQKSLINARIALSAPATTAAVFNNSISFYSSNENWTRINPRGPPSTL